MAKKEKPNDAKLRELILHICDRSEGDPKFGFFTLGQINYRARVPSNRKGASTEEDSAHFG